MNENFALGLNNTGLMMLAIIIIIVVVLMFNSKMKTYLTHHFILKSALSTLLLVCLWYIGNEFMEWWLSGIIAIFISILIEKIAKI